MIILCLTVSGRGTPAFSSGIFQKAPSVLRPTGAHRRSAGPPGSPFAGGRSAFPHLPSCGARWARQEKSIACLIRRVKVSPSSSLLGGNALGNTPQEQLQLVKDTARTSSTWSRRAPTSSCHGNGPQVGMINNAFAYASADDGKTGMMPFPEASAMSQGLHRLPAVPGHPERHEAARHRPLDGLRRRRRPWWIRPDPAFRNPTKPVGAFPLGGGQGKAAETGWTF